MYSLKKQKILFFLLSIILFHFSLCNMAFAENTFTRKEAEQLVLQSAVQYQTKGKELLQQEIQAIPDTEECFTKIEGYTIISRAFGTLPAPKAKQVRMGQFGVSYTDIPQWAEKDMENLAKAGILDQSKDGCFHGAAKMHKAEFQLLLSRIWAYLGDNPKDDFYAAVNKEQLSLQENEIVTLTDTALEKLSKENDKKLGSIFADLQSGSYLEGTLEKKAADFYSTALDIEGQNKAGIKPLQKYLDSIDQAVTVEGLVKAEALILKETGTYHLFGNFVSPDWRDTTQNVIYFLGLDIIYEKENYEMPKFTEAFQSYISGCLYLTGVPEKEAETRGRQVYALLDKISKASVSSSDKYNTAKAYHPYTKEAFCRMFPQIDMYGYLADAGLLSGDKVIVIDEGAVKKLVELLQEENLEALKNYMKVSLLYDMREYVGDGMQALQNQFYETYFGASLIRDPKERAVLLCKTAIPNTIGRLYIKKYFSEDTKRELEAMAADLIGSYQEAIRQSHWLSEPAKKKAVEKLAVMKVKIGYPDSFPAELSNIPIKGSKDGGTLVENIMMIDAEQRKASYSALGQPPADRGFSISVYDCNAYYDTVRNEIVFPAGILQPPFYEPNGKKEQNLAMIGTVLAHEISHGFDQTGAGYDGYGNADTWWTEEDYQRYERLCERVIQLYDGYETAPGISVDGTLTLSENIADIGAMECVLAVLEEEDNPDYKLFFESYAKMWWNACDRPYLEYLSSTDMHSNGKARVNKVVQNFDPFYQAYGIDESDGMYLPEDRRISIWQ